MATYTPTLPIDLDGGRKPPAPPAGGAGDRRPDGQDYAARLRRARLGLICAVATVCMIFVSLTSAYIIRRGLPTYEGNSTSYVRDWSEVRLPWLLLAINTVVLLVSSATMELARRNAARQAALAQLKTIPGVSLGREERFPWLWLTVLLGFGFLGGQWLAWSALHDAGFYVNTNPSSSFAFLLTIAHALHLTGGLIALIWAATASLLLMPMEKRHIVIDVTAWYWHFMALLWLYVFALLAFAR
jgi:cytochrome c oxidase subunit 3